MALEKSEDLTVFRYSVGDTSSEARRSPALLLT